MVKRYTDFIQVPPDFERRAEFVAGKQREAIELVDQFAGRQRGWQTLSQLSHTLGVAYLVPVADAVADMAKLLWDTARHNDVLEFRISITDPDATIRSTLEKYRDLGEHNENKKTLIEKAIILSGGTFADSSSNHSHGTLDGAKFDYRLVTTALETLFSSALGELSGLRVTIEKASQNHYDTRRKKALRLYGSISGEQTVGHRTTFGGHGAPKKRPNL